MARSLKSQVRRSVKRELKKTSPMTFVIPVICLIVGFLIAYFALPAVFGREPAFALTGKKAYTVAEGERFTYTEEGFTAGVFGLDLSANVKVESNMTKDATGAYVLDTSKGGRTYYIAYTLEHALFPSSPRLVRTFTVSEGGSD